GVKIHGFIIQGPDPSSGYYSSGVVIGGASVEIYDNDFQVTNAGSLDDVSQAIQTYHELAIPGVDISGLSIHSNTFTNHGSGLAGYEAIYVNRDAGIDDAEIQDNEFAGDVLRAVTTERSNTTISGNTIITDLAPGLPGGYVGILVRDYIGAQDSVQVMGNIVKGSEEGKGFLTGILIGASGQSLTNIMVTGNAVEMNDVGIKVRSSANGVVVNCNNITHNTTYGVENADDVNNLDATKNWWGDVSGPGGEGTGTGDAVSMYVTFEPWSLTPDPCEPKSKGFWKNHPDSLEAVLALVGTPWEIGTFEIWDHTDAEEIFNNASAKYAENMLAAQLLAAGLNAVHLMHLNIDLCDEAMDAIQGALNLLNAEGYNGPDSLEIKGKDKQPYLELAEDLDDFNNGELC
ncbi:hypothetical protein ACFLVX_05550, partial [Chloroflexota bacterium]